MVWAILRIKWEPFNTIFERYTSIPIFCQMNKRRKAAGTWSFEFTRLFVYCIELDIWIFQQGVYSSFVLVFWLQCVLVIIIIVVVFVVVAIVVIYRYRCRCSSLSSSYSSMFPYPKLVGCSHFYKQVHQNHSWIHRIFIFRSPEQSPGLTYWIWIWIWYSDLIGMHVYKFNW